MNNRRLLYLFAFLEGATVMVVELLGARMIAPVYGASLIVWTIVLSVAVGGLAMGYYMGGRFAGRKNHEKSLLILLASAAVFVVSMPVLAMLSMQLFSRLSFWLSLAVSAIIFFLPPVLWLGSTTPIITRMLSANSEAAGSEAGRVFGVSTLGGIAATFIAGFYVIPAEGLTYTSLFTGLLLGVVPCILLVRQRRFYLPALLALVSFLSVKHIDHRAATGIDVLYRSEGLLGQLLVADVPRNDSTHGYDRVLFVNRMGQTWIDREDGGSRWDYVKMLPSMLENPHGSDVLLLGLGGGTVAKVLEESRNAEVDAVEMDERIAGIARKYFGLSSETNVIIDDARHYIRIAKKKYDAVIFDVFKGEVPPSHALTLECFEEVKQLLKPGGKVIVNFNGFFQGKEGRAGRSICKTLDAAGFIVSIYPTGKEEEYRNILYVGQPVVKGNVPVPFNGLSENHSNPIPVDPGDGIVLRDDSPILEILNLPAAQRWRQDYNAWTRSFTSQGIPLFE